MKKSFRSITVFIVLLGMTTLKLGAQLSGIVTINKMLPASATNYTSFTSLATVLNANGISGTLIVNVDAGTGPYNEQVNFNQISGASSTNTITINGNGNVLSFSGSASAPYTFLLNGTDYMIVNNLLMWGTNTNYAIVCLLTNSANHNRFAACTFSAPANGMSTYHCPFAFSSSSTGLNSGGDPGNNNTVSTSTISGGYYGIYHYGASSGAYTHDNSFLNCYITDFYYYGIYCYYSKNLTIKGCKVDRLTRTTFSTTYLMYGYGSQGMLVEGNTFEKLYNSNTAYTGTLYGLAYIGSYNPASQDVNPCRVINNVFKDINFNGTVYCFYYSYYSDTKFLHNTLSFDQATATGGSTYGFYYIYGGNGMYASVVNNNISITRGGTGAKYGFYNGGTALTGVVVNNNNIYVNGTGGNNYIGYVSAQASTCATWTIQGVDANGTNVDPQYVSIPAGDLRPTNSALNNKGVSAGVATDYAFATRNKLTPDIGAYEFLNPNCSGTPPANSVTASAYTICPGENINLTVGSYSGEIGTTYQWLASDQSAVGPWTVVPNASSVNYSPQGISNAMYYGVSISCTNAPGSTTAAATIDILSSTTNTAPYFESFEGITKSDKLPNCSWYAPNLGSSVNTYVSSNTQGRMPRTGTKFASFYYLPAGQNHMYTNGIYLNAGITYSASVWYETDYFGYSNFTDLSILYGASQNTIGSISIASTNGPAVSNVYKQLANTFTVATSGIYFVDIRVTSTSGSAQYLSWDDLSITIPCNLNSPSVTLTTNSTTICSGDDFELVADGADTYTWSTGSNLNTISETPLQSTVYTLLATNDLSGCTSTLTQTVLVNPVPAVFVTANIMSICEGQYANITAIGNALYYSWSNNTNGISINVSPTVTSSYAVSGYNSFGCETTASLVITVKNNPKIIVSTSQPKDMCSGETQVLTAAGGTTYQWIASGSGVISQGNPININPTSSTSYTVTGTDASGCSSKTSLTQNVSVCTGLKVNSLKDLSVYPNPTSNDFTIALINTSEKIIIVMDLTGRIISTTTSSSETIKINLSDLSNGIYYVKIQCNSATDVVKLVKN